MQDDKQKPDAADLIRINAELLKKQKETERLRIHRQYEEEVLYKETRLNTVAPLPPVDQEEAVRRHIQKASRLLEKPATKIDFLRKPVCSKIKFESHQLMAIGAVSGNGKTTSAADIAYSLGIEQKKKVLILSTEEPWDMMWGRIIQCHTGINAKMFADRPNELEQSKLIQALDLREEYLNNIVIISPDTVKDQEGRINGHYIQTLDGFKHLWASLKHSDFDAIIIDYFQKIDEDSRKPNSSEPVVLKNFAKFLDAEKNKDDMPPIVIMCQLKAPDGGETVHVKNRIEWCKGLYNVATDFIEIVSKPHQFESAFVVWKSRYEGEIAQVTMGFDKVFRRYVSNDAAFRQKANFWIQQRLTENPVFQKTAKEEESDD